MPRSAGIVILEVEARGGLLDQVIRLADANRQTLGYLPKAVFADAASHHLVLAATIAKCSRVCGYTLFRYVQSRQEVSITHLCVDQEYQRRGIARALLDDLSARYHFARGLSALCRTDYAASAVWPRLAFSAEGEKPGRATRGSILRRWWRDHCHANLFERSRDHDNKLAVVIDANVFYDFAGSTSEDSEARGLLADWLTDEIDLIYAPEMKNEIADCRDAATREARREYLRQFQSLRADHRSFQTKLDELAGVLQIRRKQDQADARHLAWAIAGRADYFVTRDGALLDAADTISRNHAVRVVRPADLIVEVLSSRQNNLYAPSRFAGTTAVTVATPTRVSNPEVTRLIGSEISDRAKPLVAAIRTAIANPLAHTAKAFYDGDGRLIALYLTTLQGAIQNVPLLRCQKTVISTLAPEVVTMITQEGLARGYGVTRILDSSLPAGLSSVLLQAGFLEAPDGTWEKPLLRGLMSTQEATDAAASTTGLATRTVQNIAMIAETAEQGSREAAVLLERHISPARLRTSRLESYVLPIQPAYAEHLFDRRLASQSLFGARPDLVFRWENVYYRSHRGVRPSPGSRILWYVSKNKRSPGSGSIRACTTVEDSSVLSASEAFRQHRRYGIYQWEDVLRTAHGDPTTDVMVITFSSVLEFAYPISFTEANKLLRDAGMKPNQFQGPLRVSQGAFELLFQTGTSTT